VTNLASGAAEIGSIVPVDPLRGFQPTGRNLVLDVNDGSITGKVRVFGLQPGAPAMCLRWPLALPASRSST